MNTDEGASSARVAVALHELELGKSLPWPIYDDQGSLLLNQGFVLANARQRDLILRRGGCRSQVADADPTAQAHICGALHHYTLYELMEYLLCRLEDAFAAVLKAEPGLTALRVGKLALELQYLLDVCPDRLLTVLLLDDGALYQLIHPLHTAVLCELIARQVQWPEERRLPMLCAALTHDLSIQDVQKETDQQSTPMSEAQWATMRGHSLASAALLEAAGVRQAEWLELVRCHHERLDGSGYPRGLRAEQLPQPARMLALADSFSAMMRYRGHRDALDTHNILTGLYRHETAQYDKRLILALIEAVGLVAPGSLVRLNNGMLAIACARAEAEKTVPLCALLDEQGQPLPAPRPLDPALPEYRIEGFVGRDQYRWLLGNVVALWPPIALALA